MFAIAGEVPAHFSVRTDLSCLLWVVRDHGVIACDGGFFVDGVGLRAQDVSAVATDSCSDSLAVQGVLRGESADCSGVGCGINCHLRMTPIRDE